MNVTGAAGYRSLEAKVVADMDTIANTELSKELRHAGVLAVLNYYHPELPCESKQQMVEECFAVNENPIVHLKEKEIVLHGRAPLRVSLPEIGEIEKYKGGCIGYHMGNNNVVVMYAYEGRTERSADDEFDSAKSFWDRFCKDRPDGPRKDVRIHVRYGAETIRSEDNLFHYSAALNRSVDATFTPVRVG